MIEFSKGFFIAAVEVTVSTNARNRFGRLIGYQNYGRGADGFDAFYDIKFW